MSSARYLLALLLVAVACTSLVSGPAMACSFYPVMVVGADGKLRSETAKEAIRRDNKFTKIRIKANTKTVRQQLADGKADILSDLAALLVPNVRPVYIWHEMCGGSAELDFADDNDVGNTGLGRHYHSMVAGTDMEGVRVDGFVRLIDLRNSEVAIPYQGDDCNPEFRARFAQYLGSRHSQTELEAIWLFLKPRDPSGRDFLRRFMKFNLQGREPPVSWSGFYDPVVRRDLNKWLSKKPEAKALVSSIDSFWHEHAPLMATDPAICPKAAAAWPERRAAWLRYIRGERDKRIRRR